MFVFIGFDYFDSTKNIMCFDVTINDGFNNIEFAVDCTASS